MAMEKQLGSDTARSAASLQESWARIRGRLRDEVGEVEYRTWLRQMTLVGIEGDEALESVELTGINSMDEGSTPMYTWTTN